MKAKFLGVEKSEYVNRSTGEKGQEYTLSLHDGQGTRQIRIPVELFRELQSIPAMSDVVVQFGFAKGRFNQHYAVVEGLAPVGKAQAAA